MSPENTLRGIGCLIVGLFIYAVQDLMIRAMADTQSLVQVMWLRGLVTLIVLGLFAFVRGGKAAFSASEPVLIFIRGFISSFAYAAYYLAIVLMPMAEAVAIVFTAPIMVTLLSSLLFGESVGWRRWSAVIIGFVAVVIVLGPQGDVFRLESTLAMTAAVTYAGVILLTGRLKNKNTTIGISFYTAVGFFVGCTVAALVIGSLSLPVGDNPIALFLLRDWRLPSISLWLLLIGLGVITSFAQFLLIKAYSIAPMSAVAPFEYSYVVWAVLFGFVFWREVPTISVWIGLSLLIWSNCYIAYRERVVQAH